MTGGSSRVEQASGKDISSLVWNWRLCCSRLTLSYIVAQIFLNFFFFLSNMVMAMPTYKAVSWSLIESKGKLILAGLSLDWQAKQPHSFLSSDDWNSKTELCVWRSGI